MYMYIHVHVHILVGTHECTFVELIVTVHSV